MERKIIVTIPEKDYEKTIWAIEKIVGNENIILPRSENKDGIADNVKRLPENFYTEDLLNPEYRTDIHRILGRLLLKYGTKKNGLLMFQIKKKNKGSVYTSIDYEDVYLATRLDDCKDNEYKKFLDGEIFTLHECTFKHDNKVRSYGYNLTYEEDPRAIDYLLKDYLTEDPSLREPSPFDHENFGDMLMTTYELLKAGELDRRAYNILRAENINTLGCLLTYSRRELLKFRNLGKRSLNIIEEALAKRGYTLKPF